MSISNEKDNSNTSNDGSAIACRCAVRIPGIPSRGNRLPYASDVISELFFSIFDGWEESGRGWPNLWADSAGKAFALKAFPHEDPVHVGVFGKLKWTEDDKVVF